MKVHDLIAVDVKMTLQNDRFLSETVPSYAIQTCKPKRTLKKPTREETVANRTASRGTHARFIEETAFPIPTGYPRKSRKIRQNSDTLFRFCHIADC